MSGLGGRLSNEAIRGPFAPNGGFATDGGFMGSAQFRPEPNVGVAVSGGPPAVPQMMPAPPGVSAQGNSSPTVPRPGQTAFNLQASPTWGAASGAPLPVIKWAGTGKYGYWLYSDGRVVLAAVPPGKAGLNTTITPESNRAAYEAILDEFIRISPGHPQRAIALAWLARVRGQPAPTIPASASAIAALTATAPTASGPVAASFQQSSTALAPTGEAPPSLLARIAAMPGKVPWWMWALGGTVVLLGAAGTGYYVFAGGGPKKRENRRRRNAAGAEPDADGVLSDQDIADDIGMEAGA